MKRTKNRIMRRTNYVPTDSHTNSKKIRTILTKMAEANLLRDKESFKRLDKQLFKHQQLQIKLEKKNQ